VKNIPFPSFTLAGGVEFGGTGWVEVFGKPLVVTANELGV
jgi:hypothetical protein